LTIWIFIDRTGSERREKRIHRGWRKNPADWAERSPCQGSAPK
jgi:hypothetical protein